jgi:hypothetical protein
MMASWMRTIPAHEKKALASVDIMAKTIKARKA